MALTHVKHIYHFDLNTVLDNDIIQAMARNTGWNDDEPQNSFEAWQLWAAEIKVSVMLNVNETPNFNCFTFIEGVKQDDSNITHNEKQFTIPLSMCKDEFITHMMKLCKIQSEDRYGRDALLKYLISCQNELNVNENKYSYNFIYVTIPEWVMNN